MSTMDKSRLMADATWEMEQLGQWTLPLELDITTVLVVIGGLQLALRHPQFKRRPSAKHLRSLVDLMIARIPETAPATKRLAELGDDPKFDQ